MRLMTKGGQPIKKGNADPAGKKCLTINFYKIIGGGTDIYVWHNKQDPKTGRWKRGKVEIFHGGREASDRLRALLESWE